MKEILKKKNKMTMGKIMDEVKLLLIEVNQQKLNLEIGRSMP